ncbi:MAG: mobile mystery protein A [Candidatus Paracaedibacter sp.]
MKQKFKNLEHDQIKQRLNWLFTNQDFLSNPRKGWIQAVRKVLGLTTTQLARKLGLSQPRITVLENAERDGTTTLKSLREVAEAMNCRFEYSFIPQKPIDQFLKERAYEVARSRIEYVSHHMELEKQGLSKKEKQAQIEQLVEELLKNPKKLWS